MDARGREVGACEFGDGPDEGIGAIGAFSCLYERLEGKQFLLQRRENAQVMHPALLIQGGDGFGAHDLAAACAHGAEGHGGIDLADERLHHLAALIDLGDDAIGGVAVISAHSGAGPAEGPGAFEAGVLQDIDVSAPIAAGNDDAATGGRPASGGRIDGNDDALQRRRRR